MSKTLGRVEKDRARKRRWYQRMREQEGYTYTPKPSKRLQQELDLKDSAPLAKEISSESVSILEAALRKKD
jgi:hypothetical protein